MSTKASSFSARVMMTAALVLMALPVFAHSGGLDADRCHTDRKAETRHCHQPADPRTFDAVVVHASDGDTVKLSNGDRVRLSSLDCPERKQRHGMAAKAALSSMVLGRSVEIEVMDTDRYGRIVGRIHVDGENVNRALVADGHCWVYRRYAKDQALYGLEADAKAARRGLWADPAPLEPWLWRRRSK